MSNNINGDWVTHNLHKEYSNRMMHQAEQNNLMQEAQPSLAPQPEHGFKVRIMRVVRYIWTWLHREKHPIGERVSKRRHV